MKTYTIRAAAGEPGWAAVPRLETGCVLWLPDAGIRAFGQFCHDAEYLYVHLRAVERDIRAEYTAPLSPVCQDSCLEFFFMHREDLRELFGIRTARTPDGWEVFYRIPLSFLRLFWPGFAFAGALRANVYKCGDLTAREHYLAWNPVNSRTPDFHRPQDFGRMVFG